MDDAKDRFDYHYRFNTGQYAFYRVPKALFQKTEFDGLSSEAKLLYGMMLDRLELSIRNNWFDEKERAYIFFTMTAFWSRKNYLRTAEDAEEQNDNNIDGIINNVSDEKERKKEHLLQEETEQEEKESVRKKLQEERRQPPNPTGKEVVKEIGEERMKA